MFYILTLMLLWTTFVTASLWWGFREVKQNIIGQAIIQARTAAEVGNRYRRWVSQLGGVYAPVEPRAPLSPLDEDRQARTVTAAEGHTLARVTPVDMTKMVYAAIPENKLGT
jgi:hypothetical protein